MYLDSSSSQLIASLQTGSNPRKSSNLNGGMFGVYKGKKSSGWGSAGGRGGG
jgi:hypothetical protein